MKRPFRRAFVPAHEVRRYTRAVGIRGLRALQPFMPALDRNQRFERRMAEKEAVRVCPKLWRAIKTLGINIQRECEFDFPLYDLGYLSVDPAYTGYLWLEKQPCCSAYEALGAAMFQRGFYSNLPERWVFTYVWIAPAHRRQGLLTKAWPYFVAQHGPLVLQYPVSESFRAFVAKQAAIQVMTTPGSDSQPRAVTAYVPAHHRGRASAVQSVVALR